MIRPLKSPLKSPLGSTLLLSPLLLALPAGTAPLTQAQATPQQANQSACQRMANGALEARQLEVMADYNMALGRAANISDLFQRQLALQLAEEERDEALEEALDMNFQRLEHCARLGGQPYEPLIDPADFSAEITNSFLPFPVGRVMTYEKRTDEGIERVVVTVTDHTRVIMGVECRVVNDVNYLDNELTETTDDYFAQDTAGNVWYFGESSVNYDEEGYISDVEGSWIAGEDGAQPGIAMPANPIVGVTFRQELLLGEAEDVATPLATGLTVNLSYASFVGCLSTLDESPLDPSEVEIKCWAPGVGLVEEMDIHTGEILELVEVER